MTWNGRQGNWDNEPVPRADCDLYHLLSGMRGTDAPTGQFSVIMACLIRYARLQRVVELGVYHGGTTVLLADACRTTGGTCVAVDQDECPDARHRLRLLGLEAPHCVFLHGKTGEVPYDGVPIDLLFIDAGHQRQEVEADWNRWTPWVKPGGWVFMDNTSSERGVMGFLMQLFQTPDFASTWQYVNCPKSYGVGVFRRRVFDDVEEIRRHYEGIR